MYVGRARSPIGAGRPSRSRGFVLTTAQQIGGAHGNSARRSRSIPSASARRLRKLRRRAGTHQPCSKKRRSRKRSRRRAARDAATRSLGARAALWPCGSGRSLDWQRVRDAAATMTESVLRNPDALLLLSQLQAKSEYAESHALDVSIYMITFGRFLQLEPQADRVPRLPGTAAGHRQDAPAAASSSRSADASPRRNSSARSCT